MDKEWAQLHTCLAEGPNQLLTFRPTASSSQQDQRLRGQTRIYLFPPPQALGGGGGSLTRHAHTPTATTREGLLRPILPRVPGECRGLCDAVCALQNLSPSSHLAQADINIHLHSLRTRLADGGGGGWVCAGGCSQRPSWSSRARAECPPILPHGPSPGWGCSKCWGTSSPSQPLRGAGC